MATTIVNRFNTATVQFRRTVNIGQLDGDASYPVKEMRIVVTKYGENLVATLSDHNSGEEIDVFLPRRYVRLFDPREALPHGLELVRGDRVGTTFNIQLRENVHH